jgi:hypothetical protein
MTFSIMLTALHQCKIKSGQTSAAPTLILSIMFDRWK